MLRIVPAFLLGVLAACGGGSKDAAAPKPDTTAEAGAPPAADAGADGGNPRPFAGSAAEATQLITDAVDKKSNQVAKCVQEYRFRTHLAHAQVAITMGIDQEGHLIGVTLPKGKEDKELTACVQSALQGAPFPRSHSGVISITRSYEELVK